LRQWLRRAGLNAPSRSRWLLSQRWVSLNEVVSAFSDAPTAPSSDASKACSRISAIWWSMRTSSASTCSNRLPASSCACWRWSITCCCCSRLRLSSALMSGFSRRAAICFSCSASCARSRAAVSITRLIETSATSRRRCNHTSCSTLSLWLSSRGVRLSVARISLARRSMSWWRRFSG